MKFIFSYAQNNACVHKTFPELAALSNHYLVSQGYETIFFGDEPSLKEFGKVEFTHKELLTKAETDRFPKWIWSLNKLVSLQKMEEPCIHVDLDLLYERVDPLVLSHDILCLHSEDFHSQSHKLMQEVFQIKPKECETVEIVSYNCGLLGGKDQIVIKKAIKTLFDYIDNNYQEIEKISNHYNKSLLSTLLVEQVWLFQILKSFGKTISTVCHIPNWGPTGMAILSKHGITHFMEHKVSPHIQKQIKDRVKLLNLKY